MNRGFPSLFCLVAIVLAPLACTSAVANVTPDSYFRMHVIDYVDWWFCAGNTIEQCDQIDRVSEYGGDLEFDLFFEAPGWQGDELHSLEDDLYYPADWYIWWFEPCAGGVGTLEQVEPGHARFSITYPDHPILSNGVFLAATFAVAVSGEGAFVTSGWGYADVWNGYWYSHLNPAGIAAQAGPCSRCAETCTMWYPDLCVPFFSPPTLDLAAESGGTASGEFLVTRNNPSVNCPAPIWADDSSWLQYEVERLDAYHYRVTATASAESLDPGVYIGWISGVYEECQGCGKVRFTVQPTSSVPATSRGALTSWGSIKWRYR